MWFLMVCLADYDPLLPPISDLDRFGVGTNEANWQMDRCYRWRTIVQEAEHLHGYGDGKFIAWRDNLNFSILYWDIYRDARECRFTGQVWGRRRLSDLRTLIGPERYLQGWSPVRMIEPPAEPMRREAGAQ